MVDLDVLRDSVGPGPSDDVLEGLLAAALEAIDMKYGVATEFMRLSSLRPFGSWVDLGKVRALSIESVTEGTDTLEDTDYELMPGGRYLRRMRDAEPQDWNNQVDVTYRPYAESASRDRLAIALVKHSVNHNPGLTSITVGPWSESYSQSSDSYTRGWDALLNSLRPTTANVW